MIKINFLNNNYIPIKSRVLNIINNPYLFMIFKMVSITNILNHIIMQINCTNEYNKLVFSQFHPEEPSARKIKLAKETENFDTSQRINEDGEVLFFLSVLDLLSDRLDAIKDINYCKIKYYSSILLKISKCLIIRIHDLNPLPVNIDNEKYSHTFKDLFYIDKQFKKDITCFPDEYEEKNNIPTNFNWFISTNEMDNVYRKIVTLKLDQDKGVLNKINPISLESHDLICTITPIISCNSDCLRLIKKNDGIEYTHNFQEIKIPGDFFLNSSKTLGKDSTPISNVNIRLQPSSENKKEIYIFDVPSKLDKVVYSIEAYSVNMNSYVYIRQKLNYFSELGADIIYSTFKVIIYFELDVLYLVDFQLQSLQSQNTINHSLYLKHQETFRNSRIKADLIVGEYENLNHIERKFASVNVVLNIINVILTSITLLNFSNCCLLLWKVHYINLYLLQLEGFILNEIATYEASSHGKLSYFFKNQVEYIILRQNVDILLQNIMDNISNYYTIEFIEIMKYDLAYFLALKELYRAFFVEPSSNREALIFSEIHTKPIFHSLKNIEAHMTLSFVYIRAKKYCERDLSVLDNKLNVEKKYKNKIERILIFLKSHNNSHLLDSIQCLTLNKDIQMKNILQDLSVLKHLLILNKGPEKTEAEIYELNNLGFEILLHIISLDIFFLLETEYKRCNSIKFQDYNYKILLTKIYFVMIKISHSKVIICKVGIDTNLQLKEIYIDLTLRIIGLCINIIQKLIDAIIKEKNYKRKIINLHNINYYIFLYYKYAYECNYKSIYNPELPLHQGYINDVNKIMESINRETINCIRFVVQNRIQLYEEEKDFLRKLSLFCMYKDDNIKDNLGKNENIIDKIAIILINQISQLKRINYERKVKPLRCVYILWRNKMIAIVITMFETYELFKYYFFECRNITKLNYLVSFCKLFLIIRDFKQIYPSELFSKNSETVYWLGINYYFMNYIIHIYVPYLHLIYSCYMRSNNAQELTVIKSHLLSVIPKMIHLLSMSYGAIENEQDNIELMYLIDLEHENKYYKYNTIVEFWFILMKDKFFEGSDVPGILWLKLHLLFFRLFICNNNHYEIYLKNLNLVSNDVRALLINSKIHLKTPNDFFLRNMLNRLYKNIELIIMPKLDQRSIELNMAKDIMVLWAKESLFKNPEFQDPNSFNINYICIFNIVCKKLKDLIEETKFAFQNLMPFCVKTHRFTFSFCYYMNYFMSKWKELESYKTIFRSEKQMTIFLAQLGSKEYKHVDDNYFKQYIEITLDWIQNKNNLGIYYRNNKLLEFMVSLNINMNMLNIEMSKYINTGESDEKINTCPLLKNYHIDKESAQEFDDLIHSIFEALNLLSDKIVNSNIMAYNCFSIDNENQSDIFRKNYNIFEEFKEYEHSFSIMDVFCNRNVLFNNRKSYIIRFFFNKSVILLNPKCEHIVELSHIHDITNILRELSKDNFDVKTANYILYELIYPLCHLECVNLLEWNYKIFHIGKSWIRVLCENEIH